MNFRRLLRDPKLIAICASGIGQILLFASMTAVSRAFSPGQISHYGVFFSIFNILQILVMFRLEQAIVYTEDTDTLSGLYSASMLLAPLTMAISGLVVFVYFRENPLTREDAVLTSFLVALAAAGTGIARVHNFLIARSDNMVPLAAANLIRPTLIAALQLTAAVIGAKFGNLEICFLVSQLVLALIMIGMARKYGAGVSFSLGLKKLRGAVIKHKTFVLFNLPQNLIFVVSESIVPLSIAFVYEDQKAIALFWLASRVVFAPATVVAESLRPQIYRAVAVAGQEAAALKDGVIDSEALPRLQRHNHMARYIYKAALALGLAVLGPLVILLFQGQFLFSLAFGETWRDANDYALILGGLVALNMAALPFVACLPILNLQGHYLVAELAGLFARLIILFLIPWSDARMGIGMSTLGYAIILILFLIFVSFRLTRKESTHARKTA